MTAAAPFLKWVGGKRALLPALAQRLPRAEDLAGYREPFLGGGAVFFGLYAAVRPARLSDANADLIAAYIAVRDHLDELGARLVAVQRYGVDIEAEFSRHRDRLNAHRAGARPLSLLERAVSVFVLNRWGFNGLWRERADGQITTPFGNPGQRALFDPGRLRACSAALQGVTLEACDFADALRWTELHELVYLDPPYAPPEGEECYTGYTGGGFTYRPRQVPLIPEVLPRTDQERLEAALLELDERGAFWVLSNQPAPALEDLRARWTSVKLSARRSVSSDPATRGAAPELLISNWPGIATPGSRAEASPAKKLAAWARAERNCRRGEAAP